MTTAAPTVPPAPRAATRSATDRAVLGVCGGLGRAFGVDPALLRLAFVALAAVGGIGAALYVAAALALPPPVERPAESAAHLQTATATVLLVGAVLVLVERAGLLVPVGLLWPATAILGGIGLAWRFSGGEVAAPRDGALWARPALVEGLRAAAAVALIVGAGAALVLQTGGVAAAAAIAVTASLIVAGIGLLVGPRLARARAETERERADRARAEERVAVAARLHDSVLQTLALIQRSDDAGRSAMLARQQERELRGWLYGAAGEGGAPTVGAALAAVAAQVEERYGVRVELVQATDAAMDDRMAECVAAAGEAITNAAKHAGVDSVSVLTRVTDGELSIFVRDRGAGFDPSAVALDRHGLSESIRGRMTRAGGRAEIASAPGEGTEVELLLPRGAG